MRDDESCSVRGMLAHIQNTEAQRPVTPKSYFYISNTQASWPLIPKSKAHVTCIRIMPPNEGHIQVPKHNGHLSKNDRPRGSSYGLQGAKYVTII